MLSLDTLSDAAPLNKSLFYDCGKRHFFLKAFGGKAKLDTSS